MLFKIGFEGQLKSLKCVEYEQYVAAIITTAWSPSAAATDDAISSGWTRWPTLERRLPQSASLPAAIGYGCCPINAGNEHGQQSNDDAIDATSGTTTSWSASTKPTIHEQRWPSKWIYVQTEVVIGNVAAQSAQSAQPASIQGTPRSKYDAVIRSGLPELLDSG